MKSSTKGLFFPILLILLACAPTRSYAASNVYELTLANSSVLATFPNDGTVYGLVTAEKTGSNTFTVTFATTPALNTLYGGTPPLHTVGANLTGDLGLLTVNVGTGYKDVGPKNLNGFDVFEEVAQQKTGNSGTNPAVWTVTTTNAISETFTDFLTTNDDGRHAVIHPINNVNTGITGHFTDGQGSTVIPELPAGSLPILGSLLSSVIFWLRRRFSHA